MKLLFLDASKVYNYYFLTFLLKYVLFLLARFAISYELAMFLYETSYLYISSDQMFVELQKNVRPITMSSGCFHVMLLLSFLFSVKGCLFPTVASFSAAL